MEGVVEAERAVFGPATVVDVDPAGAELAPGLAPRSPSGETMHATTDVILKRFDAPDEVRDMIKGRFEIVRLGGMRHVVDFSDDLMEKKNDMDLSVVIVRIVERASTQSMPVHFMVRNDNFAKLMQALKH